MFVIYSFPNCVSHDYNTSWDHHQRKLLGNRQEHIHGYPHDRDHGTSGENVFDYDNDHPVFVSEIARLLPKCLFFFLLTVIVFGFVGNSLILGIVFIQKKKRTISSYFVASLATTDTIVLLTCGILHLVVLSVPAFLLDPFDFPWAAYNCFTFIHLVSRIPPPPQLQ